MTLGIKLTVTCLLLGLVADAREIRVPEGAPTVQAALDSLSSGDTVLVSQGIYFERLVSPSFEFALIGEWLGDSTGNHIPIIDATDIDAPDTTAVLSLSRHSIAHIENLYFRNTGRNGIRSWSDGVFMRNCLVDSVYEGFRQVADSIGACVRLEHCKVLACCHLCVIVRVGNSLEARNCSFTGGISEGVSFLVGTNESIVDSCSFASESSHILYIAVRGPHTITNCTFGPITTPAFENAVSLGDSQLVFENNTIVDCAYGHHAVRIYSHHPDSVIVRDNTYVRCRGLDVGLSAAGALGILYGIAPTGHGALVEGNSFVNCSGHVTADAIWPPVFYPTQITGNHFLHDSLNGLPSIGGSGSPWQSTPVTLRSNRFEECGYALDGSAETDARANWWGHSSGPYHETLNPAGLGDTISGPVQFIPWLTDTTQSAEDAHPMLPDQFSLGTYPNPFNPATTLSFTLDRAEHINLVVFDVGGRHITNLQNGMLSAGLHEVEFDGTHLASGMYFARLSSPVSSVTTKLVLLK